MSTTFAVMLEALPFLWRGLLITLAVSALVVVLSLVAGTLLGLLRVYGTPLLQAAVQVFSDIIRGVPVLVLVFFVFYGLPSLGLYVNSFSSAVLALALFSTAQVSELVRGALQSIHHGQNEAAKAIGLTFEQRMLSVILPQATRRFLPAWINSVTDAVKGSALVSLIGVVDLMLAIQQVIGRTYQALPLYVLGGAIYFAINYGLSLLSRHYEVRLSYYQVRE
jgi:polar amino acid transport system permease protein